MVAFYSVCPLFKIFWKKTMNFENIFFFEFLFLPIPGWGFVKVSESRGAPCVVMGRFDAGPPSFLS